MQRPDVGPYHGKRIKDGPVHKDLRNPLVLGGLASGMPEHFEAQELAGSNKGAFAGTEGAGGVLWQRKSVQTVLAYKSLPLN